MTADRKVFLAVLVFLARLRSANVSRIGHSRAASMPASIGDVDELIQALNNSQAVDESVKVVTSKVTKSLLDSVVTSYSVLDQLYVNDLDAEQVWEQVRMVVEGAVRKAPKVTVEESDGSIEPEGSEVSDEELIHDNEDELSEASEAGKAAEAADSEVDAENEEELEDLSEQSGTEPGPESIADDPSDYKKDRFGLNDGFFSIDEFNRATLEAERQDQEAFGSNDELYDDNDDYDEGDDIKYEDFFAPAKAAGANTKKQKTKTVQFADSESDRFEGLTTEATKEQHEHVMQSSLKDLFDSESEGEDNVTDNDKTVSRYQKSQNALLDEIRRLERENVAQKDWQLRGEVKGRDRPLNALVDEDLEFERGAKPVPVISQEVTDSLEDMIRNRIANSQFDDIARRIPDSVPEFNGSRRVQVSESKSEKSLAEVYEDDYKRQVDPEQYTDPIDSQLKQEHAEIEQLFNDIVYKLDALSSWNFTPKAPSASISIVSNVDTIQMEDAQPSTFASEQALAPHEVYNPQEEKSSKDTIMRRSNLPSSRAELTKEERKRLRRQVKEKQSRVAYAKAEKRRAQAQVAEQRGITNKASIAETLKRGNVTVIGKSGEKRTIDGKAKHKEGRRPLGSGFKL
ncbi:hypothetical protein CANCADRAFT_2235 [Tortispora caseinolytica NRRL Y-17796]|uniref:U3 small nucleolar ribonucleoprotein protein MPP10 n=1 Tax=Tortispora caseinolytica NRRL Y-17796 TaxID=767744 RepID=A0A1E4TFR1_9ASCO|nr:hypothetical protein CANCADRAFT_2235 [Tortispora caseinolytica NRRL Y-17796]